MLIQNACVYTEAFRFAKRDVRVINDRIDTVSAAPLRPYPVEEVIDAAGKWLIPGLTDIHFHGCVSHDTNDATEEALRAMAKYLRSCGVTTILPTTMTLPKAEVERIVRTAEAYSHTQKRDEAVIVGVNLEGPFISKDRVGAQNPLYVQEPDADFVKKLQEETGHFAKIITVAPEVDKAMDFIEKLHDEIRISIGHTMTDYETAKEAYKKGAKHLTHMFNAMPGLHHRNPGPMAAAQEAEDVTCEIICDGVHIHPAMIRAAFSLMGPEKMILISDSCRAAGMPDGEYELGGQKIFKHDHAAFLEDGTLAASATNVYDCMVNAIDFGIPAEDAIRAATYNPARAAGILERYGSIEEGKKARMVLIDPKNHYRLVRVF